MTDPISDLLTRIRNAQTAGHESVSAPYSHVKMGILKILKAEGYVSEYHSVDEEGKAKEIKVSLRYSSDKVPMISMLQRMSRPGRRYYIGYHDIKPVRNGVGLAILSTPKGILSDTEARAQKVGGEVLCKIW